MIRLKAGEDMGDFKKGQNRKCKGMRDLLPVDMSQFRHVEGVFRDCCGKWSYQEVMTPTLEYMHLFTSAGTFTPEMLGRVYSFLDWDGWSGERVVLRPDCTIPVARLYIDEKEEHTDRARLFYIMNVFAFEQTGRESRERWQCGAEFLGDTTSMADAELMALGLEVLTLLGLPEAELRLSHVGILRAVLKELSLSEEERGVILDNILDGDTTSLLQASEGNGEVKNFLSLMLGRTGRSKSFVHNLRSLCNEDMTEARTALDDFERLIEVVEAMGCPYQIDMASARGFEYYTGVTFQFFVGDENVGAGGRYDALIPLMGGRGVPASGFALYLDKLVPLLQPSIGTSLPWKGVRVSAAETSPEILMACAEAARMLREAGFTAEFDFSDVDASSRWNWTMIVEGPPLMFTLISSDGRKTTASSASEVLQLLEEA